MSGLVYLDANGNLIAVEGPILTDDNETQSLLAALEATLDERIPVPTLTERMFTKRVADGYQLWLDTSDSSHLYTCEGPVGADPATATTWRGVRVTLDATGFPNGPVEVADGFAWDARTAFGGWA